MTHLFGLACAEGETYEDAAKAGTMEEYMQLQFLLVFLYFS